MKGDCHNKPIKYLFLQAENPPALDMHESTLLYIKQGLKVHKRAFSPVIIIGDHVYRVFFTHSPLIGAEQTTGSAGGCDFQKQEYGGCIKVALF